MFAGQRMFRGSAGRERFACQPLFERSGLGEKLFDHKGRTLVIAGV